MGRVGLREMEPFAVRILLARLRILAQNQAIISTARDSFCPTDILTDSALGPLVEQVYAFRNIVLSHF